MRSREKVHLACAGFWPRCLNVHVPFPFSLMIKAARLILCACALVGFGAIVAACGGVPGNAVATVDGESIDKTDFTHWMNIAAKTSGQPGAAVPDPPSYTECIAAKRKATPTPAKGQPKVTDAQLKTQCRTEYNTLRDSVLQNLISFKWIQGEADAQGIKVSDAEVKKAFEQQKKQSFPKDADYQKFLKTSGYTQEDIPSGSRTTSWRTRSATRSSRARTPSPTPRCRTSTARTRPASPSRRSATCASC